MTDTLIEVGQLVSVDKNATMTKKDGATYQGLKLVYQVNGRERTKTLHKAFLSKKVDMMAKLEKMETGATIEVKTQGAPFFSLEDATEVAPGTASPSPMLMPGTTPKFPAKPTYVDNSIGMQVGNALTNAATLIAGGAKGTLEEVAVSVLQLGEALKARLIAGEFSATKAPAPTAAPKVTKKATPKVEEDENIFEDD